MSLLFIKFNGTNAAVAGEPGYRTNHQIIFWPTHHAWFENCLGDITVHMLTGKPKRTKNNTNMLLQDPKKVCKHKGLEL